MSSPFAFIPRKLTKPNSSLRPVIVSPNAKASTLPTTADSIHTANEKGKEKALDGVKQATKFTDEDNASFVCLALSDYALWSDTDLRRRIDQGQLQTVASEEEPGEGTRSIAAREQNGGFIPLSYLIKHSGILSPILGGTAETTIIKALRTYAVDFVDVRLLFAAPSSSGWYRGGSSSWPSQGGYEVRRKDWATASRAASSTYSKNDWEILTVYMENIPIRYRSIPGIAQFTRLLLGDHPTLTRVQHISLPPHHQDKAGDRPVCKGFALVTLQAQEDVERLVQAWNWDRDNVNDDTGIETEIGKEAFKFGFRALPKARWDKLKAEYLLYRKQLVNEINEFQDNSDAALGQNARGSLLSTVPDGEGMGAWGFAGKTRTQLGRMVEMETEAEEGRIMNHESQTGYHGNPVIDQCSPYPYGCLLFVKNVHPETNKTTLRALFSLAFIKAVSSDKDTAPCMNNAGDALDYVDFNKGMDTCHLRVSAPAHARLLSQQFTQNSTVQVHGLDDSGTSNLLVDPGMKPIVIEIVQGKREEVYWQKVPDKVRRQAVEKAILALSGGRADDSGQEEIEGPGREEGRKRKKRRKH